MLGQLWTLDGTTLRNKLGVWKSYGRWNITNNETYIENASKNKILGTLESNIVGIQPSFHESEKSWKLGKRKTDGYFTITHLTSQKLLVPTNDVDNNSPDGADDLYFEGQSLRLIFKGK